MSKSMQFSKSSKPFFYYKMWNMEIRKQCFWGHTEAKLLNISTKNVLDTLSIKQA